MQFICSISRKGIQCKILTQKEKKVGKKRAVPVPLLIVIQKMIPKSKVGIATRTTVLSDTGNHTIAKYKKILKKVLEVSWEMRGLTLSQDSIIFENAIKRIVGSENKNVIGKVVGIAISDLKDMGLIIDDKTTFGLPVVSIDQGNRIINGLINSNTTKSSWRFKGYKGREMILVATLEKKNSMSLSSFNSTASRLGFSGNETLLVLNKMKRKKLVNVSSGVRKKVVTLLLPKEEDKINIVKY